MRLNQVRGALVGLLALGALAAQAGPIDPQTAGVHIEVGGQQVTTLFADENGRLASDGFTVRDDLGNAVAQIMALSASINPDPFIAYSLGVQNFTAAPLTFIFGFFSPYLGGPYDTMDSSHSSSVTDGSPSLDDQVTITPYSLVDSLFVHVPHVDGTAVAAARLGTGCVADPPGTCDAASSTSTGVATLASGTFDVFVAFSISAHDGYSAAGNVELRNANTPRVPEPSTLALLCLGAGMSLLRGRRKI